jgi:hypothetical protein
MREAYARVMLTLVTVLCITFFAHSTAAQDTPPRPTVAVRQMPTLVRSLIPGDFNGDGRMDLVAGVAEFPSDTNGPVAIRFGLSDGTMSLPRAIGATGTPVAVGDFNGDRRLDIVVENAGAIGILPGRGDGTFQNQRPLGTVSDFRHAVAAELNGDSRVDLVIGHGTSLEVRPGRGDFTFGPTMTLPPGNELGSVSATLADFDGNGLLDLAVPQQARSVFVYLNRGGLIFNPSEMVIGDAESQTKQVAAGDLNGDRRADLVVPVSNPDPFGAWLSSVVQIRFGNGDGTFASPVERTDVLNGQLTAGIADFNRDGLPDIALGAQSFFFDDEITFGDHALVLWDSVTFLLGNGSGEFATDARFRLDTSNTGTAADLKYQGTHEALRIADMDGDGRPDVIATPGAVLLTRPPAPNRPPTINVGPDLTVSQFANVILAPTISEPDWDWLDFQWRVGSGAGAGRSSRLRPTQVDTETHTVTVTDARGASASDSVTVTRVPRSGPIEIEKPLAGQRFASGSGVQISWEVSGLEEVQWYRVSVSTDDFRTSRVIGHNVELRRFVWENAGPASTMWQVKVEALNEAGDVLGSDVSGPFIINPPGSSAPPWPWLNRDIGLVGAAGSATLANGRFAVRGAGSDIWNTADEFHFVYQRVDGDVIFEGRIASIAGQHPWTKVGLMIRQSLAADSIHHFALGSLSKGLAYQRRTTTGGESTNTALGTDGAGATFRISRVGGAVRIEIKRQGEATFSTVAVEPFPTGSAYVGLAVTSHDWSRLATGTFDSLVLRTGSVGLPSGWTNADVGAVSAAGRASYHVANDRFTVDGSGADIWGTADEFHFVSRTVVGEGAEGFEITALVSSVENVNRWTKAGLMVRAHRGAGAAHASIFVTPTTEKGVAFQRRRADGAMSVHTSGPAITAPVWLKLIVSNGFVRAFVRQSITDRWTPAGEDRISLAPPYEAGLAVSSHVDGTLARATFDEVTAVPRPTFESRDIGMVGVPGTTTTNDITRTLEGSGADIWGTADAFRYHFAPLSPGGTISATVVSIEPTHRWAKAGVMMRANTSPGSPHVMLVVSASRGIAMQYRATANGETADVAIVPGAAPSRVRLVRDGDLISGQVFESGGWNQVGVVRLPLGSSPTAGIVVTSHDNTTLATGVFEDVLLIP